MDKAVLKQILYQYLNFSYGLKDLVKGKEVGDYLEKQILANSLSRNLSIHEQLIALIEKEENQDLESQIEVKEIIISLPSFNTTREEFKRELESIKSYIKDKELEQYGDFVLVGSMATNDYVKEFSDVDIVLFLKPSFYSSPRNLQEFRKKIHGLNGLLLKIDPLQNHGVFVVLPSEREGYIESENMPIEVLKKGQNLGSVDLVLKIKVAAECTTVNDKIFDAYIALVSKELLLKNESYRFFRDFLHRVYLLPIMYLQSRGTHTYKKESFVLIDNYQEFKCVKKLAEIYNQDNFKNRHFRFVPDFFFISYPLFFRLLLNFVYGKKNQKIIHKSELDVLLTDFKKLLMHL